MIGAVLQFFAAKQRIFVGSCRQFLSIPAGNACQILPLN
jgi:hypothetical protein